jgi:CRP-like cAMP-binding protein
MALLPKQHTLLSASPLFRGIAPDDIENLLRGITFQVKNYQRGQVIASRDEECNFLIILLAGSVKGEMLDFSGKILKIEDIYPPRPLAPAFLFGKKNKYPVDIVANEPTSVMFISREMTMKIFQENEVFLSNYLNTISNRAQFLTEKLFFLSFKSIKEKLANYILSLAKPYKTEIMLDKSHHELAELFGVTRPSLSRAIGDLEKRNLIKAERKTIKILDRESLSNL